MNEMKERTNHETPSRKDIIHLVATQIYGGGVLNNSHRGDVVEMMVLSALGSGWKHVGLGWHPWDLQRGQGDNRVRVQVRQTAAVQLWGDTKTRSLNFRWRPKAPAYFERDNPGEKIESEGWFCDIFVFGIHDETDASIVDPADPKQWKFMVVPTYDLLPGTKQMLLSKAIASWPSVTWSQLRSQVEGKVVELNKKRTSC